MEKKSSKDRKIALFVRSEFNGIEKTISKSQTQYKSIKCV